MHQDRYIGKIPLHCEGLFEEVVECNELVGVFPDSLVILPSDHLVMIDLALLKAIPNQLLLSQPKNPVTHSFHRNSFGFDPVDDYQVLLILECLFPVCIALFFVFTGQWAKHDDHVHLAIPDHLPEVRDGGTCRRLLYTLRILCDDATVLR